MVDNHYISCVLFTSYTHLAIKYKGFFFIFIFIYILCQH